jgi:glycosyltransferase involved in cell wall biosynthesis
MPHDEFTILTTASRGRIWQEKFSRNGTIVRLPCGSLATITTATLSASMRFEPRIHNIAVRGVHLFEEAARRRWLKRRIAFFDLVHVHSLATLRHYDRIAKGSRWSISRGIARLYADFRALGKPILYTDHSFFVGSYERFVANSCGVIVDLMESLVCVEESGYRNVLRYSKENGLSRNVWLMPNAVDTDLFRYYPPSEGDEFAVGFAGRVEKEGLDMFAALVREAPENLRFKACLAGNPGSLPKELARSPQLAVRWNVASEEMPDFYRSVNVLLDAFPVGIPRTTIESLASGRPVIRIRDGRHSEASLISPEISPCFPAEDLADALELIHRLRESPVAYGRLCEASRQVAENTFSASMIANRYRDIYVASIDQSR